MPSKSLGEKIKGGGNIENVKKISLILIYILVLTSFVFPVKGEINDIEIRDLFFTNHVETVVRREPLPSRSGDIRPRRSALEFFLPEKEVQDDLQNSSLDGATVMTVEVTAYCPGISGSGCPLKDGLPYCTGAHANGFTATGVKAEAGDGTIENPHIIAVDPDLIPLHTMVYIPDYGYALAEDVGGAIKGQKIDLLFDKHKDALVFGRQQIDILVLTNLSKSSPTS